MTKRYRQLRGALPLIFFLFWHQASPLALAEQGPAAPDALRLELKAGKTRLYPGEPVALTVTLLAGELPLRDIQYPRITGSSFRVGQFGLPGEREVVRDGKTGTAYDFTTSITARRSGTLALGPAELQCDLLAPAVGSAAFFGGTQKRRVSVTSEPLTLTVLPIPAQGRPRGFSGAVGSFTVSVSAQPRELHAGDPVTVRTVIRGEGSLEQFSCNPSAAPGFVSYPPRAGSVGDSLTCEQVLIPRTQKVREVPAVAISFFDPASERFRTVRSVPVPLRVTPPEAPAASAPPVPIPPPAAPARGSAPPQRVDRPVAGVALLSIAAALVGIWIAARCRRRATVPPPAVEAASGPRPQEWLAAAEAAVEARDAEAFYRAAFRATQALTAARLQLPAAGWTGPLPEELLPAQLHGPASALLKRCDLVRYGRESADHRQLAHDLGILQQLLASTPSR